MTKTLKAPSSLHASRITLPQETRLAVLPLLQTALYATIDLKWRIKQAHWNIKGPNFIALHNLFDELAAEQDVHADELAERMTALGGHPISDIREVASNSILGQTPLKATTANELLTDLAEAYATMHEDFANSIERSGEANDSVTEDLFTGMTRTLAMRLWFIEAHFAN
jgi:starvation-inducible DNA-binding protein